MPIAAARPPLILGALLAAFLPALAFAAPPVRAYQACLDRVARDPVAGREAAGEWLRFGRGGVQASLCEANALAALGAHASAARSLQEAAPTAPKSVKAELLALAAEFWLAGGRGPEAEAAANAALTAAAEGDPLRVAALRVRARLRLAEGAWTAAAIDLTGALGLAAPGERAGLRAARARARNGMEDAAGALADADAALAADSALAAAWLEKGRAELALGRPDAARESLLQAIVRDAEGEGGPSAAAARALLQAQAYGG